MNPIIDTEKAKSMPWFPRHPMGGNEIYPDSETHDPIATFLNAEDCERAIICHNACLGISDPERLRTERDGWKSSSESFEWLHAKRHEEVETLKAQITRVAQILDDITRDRGARISTVKQVRAALSILAPEPIAT